MARSAPLPGVRTRRTGVPAARPGHRLKTNARKPWRPPASGTSAAGVPATAAVRHDQDPGAEAANASSSAGKSMAAALVLQHTGHSIMRAQRWYPQSAYGGWPIAAAPSSSVHHRMRAFDDAHLGWRKSGPEDSRLANCSLITQEFPAASAGARPLRCVGVARLLQSCTSPLEQRRQLPLRQQGRRIPGNGRTRRQAKRATDGSRKQGSAGIAAEHPFQPARRPEDRGRARHRRALATVVTVTRMIQNTEYL